MEDIWDESAIIPFWGTQDQLEKLSSLVCNCVDTVTESENPREMVIETWLVLDYAVRDLIISGYGLAKFCKDDFDLRYVLLPNSFEALLQLFKKTISAQSKLHQEPKISDSDSNSIDEYPPHLQSDYGFMKFIKENYGDISNRLEEIEKEYFIKQHPELIEQIEQGYQFYYTPKEKGIERLPNEWFEVVNDLEDDWFKSASKLNTARNIAAHSHNPSNITKAFGKAGPKKVDMVRSECLDLLVKLLGITLNDKSPRNR
jgi:hypothetical protein